MYGSLQIYGAVAQPLATAAEELLETIPTQAPSTQSVTAGAFAEAAHAELDRYRAVYPDFPAYVEVRDDISELMVSFGRLIAQEFVRGGEDGDAWIFLLEGQILERDRTLAAFRRVPTGNDQRANISAGGRSVPLEIGEAERGIIEAMGTKLVADGMYFVGIDVIGDKVVEINAESPGGMQSVERLYHVDVCPTVIDVLKQRASSEP